MEFWDNERTTEKLRFKQISNLTAIVFSRFNHNIFLTVKSPFLKTVKHLIFEIESILENYMCLQDILIEGQNKYLTRRTPREKEKGLNLRFLKFEKFY